jgi:hypothetical protein
MYFRSDTKARKSDEVQSVDGDTVHQHMYQRKKNVLIALNRPYIDTFIVYTALIRSPSPRIQYPTKNCFLPTRITPTQLACHVVSHIDRFVRLPAVGVTPLARSFFHAVRVHNPIKFVVSSERQRVSSVNERRQFTRNTASAND